MRKCLHAVLWRAKHGGLWELLQHIDLSFKLCQHIRLHSFLSREFSVCVQAYGNQKVCYALLAQRILAALPQTDDGVWLMKSTEYGTDTFAQVWMIYSNLFMHDFL